MGAGVSTIVNLFHRIRRKLKPPAEKIHGYEDAELVNVIFKKTLAYDPPREEWPDVLRATTVLDFGGACGAHYKEALHHVPDVRWAVVETPAMVGKASEIATDRLRFFTTVAQASAWLGPVDLMHSSGALQFAPEPETLLTELCGLGAKRMHWRRLVLSRDQVIREMQSSFLTDNGPGGIKGVQEKRVEYERIRVPENVFLDAHAGRYRLVERGEDWFRFTLR